MRDYGKISPAFWIGDTGRRLRGDPAAQVVALYLMTGPSTSMTGLYHLTVATIAHDVGLAAPHVRSLFARLSELGVAYIDEVAELVWVPEMAKFQVAASLKPNDARRIGCLNQIEPFARHVFHQHFIHRYRTPFSLPVEAPPEGARGGPPGKPVSVWGPGGGLGGPMGGPTGGPPTDQDQDQEQEQGEADLPKPKRQPDRFGDGIRGRSEGSQLRRLEAAFTQMPSAIGAAASELHEAAVEHFGGDERACVDACIANLDAWQRAAYLEDEPKYRWGLKKYLRERGWTITKPTPKTAPPVRASGSGPAAPPVVFERDFRGEPILPPYEGVTLAKIRGLPAGHPFECLDEHGHELPNRGMEFTRRREEWRKEHGSL